MKTESPLLIGSVQVRRLVWALPLVVLLGMGVHLWRLWTAHDQLSTDTLARAAHHAMQLAEAKAGQIESLLGGADSVLRQFREHYASGNPQAVQDTVRSAFQSLPQGSVVHFSVSDARGDLVFSTLDLSGPVNVADREHIRFHSGQVGDQLYIGKPVQSRITGQWMVLLTRPLLQAGQFRGVVAMSISPEYLSAALARLQVAPDDAIGLFHNDGTYFARNRGLDKVIGTRMPADRPFLGDQAPTQGSLRLVAFADQRTRIYGWQRLRGFPLVLAVGLDEAAVLAPLQADEQKAIWLALSLVALLAGATSLLLYRNLRQQGRLAAGQAMLRATLESSADGILAVGDKGQVLDHNQRFEQLLQVPAALARGGSDDDLLQHVRGQLVEPLAFAPDSVALQADDTQRTQLLPLKDGRTFECHTRAVQLEDQRVRLWAFRDITERRRLEDALRQSDQRFRTLFESSPDAVLIIEGSRIIECNPAAVALFGCANRECVIGLHPAELSPPQQADGGDSRKLAAERLAAAQAQGLIRFEWLHCRTDGQAFHAEVTLSAMKLQGRPVVHAVVRDITARKQAEDQLRQSETRVRAMIDGARDGILTADVASRRLLDANPAICAMLGYERHELLALGVDDLHPPEHLPKVRQVFEQQARNEYVLAQDLPMRRKNGEIFFADISTATVIIDGRQTLSGFFRDVTERRAAQAELAQHRQNLEALVEQRTRQLAGAKADAEAANVAKSVFLANMSHEIRTPLNAITGMTQIMKRQGVTPQQADRLGKIETAGLHLLEIINAVLDLSKIEAGKFALDETDVDVGALVARTAAMLVERAQAKGLQLVSEVQHLPQALRGDATRLQQALLNYATNAIKFTPTGTVTLRALPVAESADDVVVRFEVQDTGIGIAPEKLARLFSVFEQGDNSITRQYGGTGLGLAINRRLAQLMGGETGAHSTPGVGSTFWFTARLRHHSGAAGHTGAPAASAEMLLQQRHPGRRVLLAEDEPVNCEITTALLEMAGLTVEVAHDGLQAVERAQTGAYDLILMDMQMPNLDGLQATQRIRLLPQCRTVPILALTANAFAEDRARCLAAGMNDFVSKPTEAHTLFATVLKWLDAAAGPGLPQQAAVSRAADAPGPVAACP